MESIIVIKPDALGDFILATPALAQLRKKNPSALITLLASSRNIKIAKWSPDVDQVIEVPLFGMNAKNITAEYINETAFSLTKIIRHDQKSNSIGYLMRFDADFYGASPLMYAMKIQKRIGYSESVLPRKSIINKGYDSFMTECIRDSCTEHEVIKNIRLICESNPFKAASICLDRYETALNSLKALDVLSRYKSNGNFLILGIGASIASKKLESKFWIQLLQSINHRFDNIFIIGSEEDKIMANEIIVECKHVSDLCGELTPMEVFSFAKHSRLAICTDSFVKHVAAAANVTTIELSAHTQLGNPNSEYGGIRFGAWGNKSYIVKPLNPLSGCTPDQCLSTSAHCISTISIEDVINLVFKVLDDSLIY